MARNRLGRSIMGRPVVSCAFWLALIESPAMSVSSRRFCVGFDHILAAQYSEWRLAAVFSIEQKYHRHITFNDGTMIRLMEFLRDATTG